MQIGSNIEDKNLNEPDFFPVWEACEKVGLAVLVHPWNMMGKKNMNKYWLPLASWNASRNFSCNLLYDIWRNFLTSFQI